MTNSELFLLALGPILALSAGLIIYALGVYAPDFPRVPSKAPPKPVDR